MKRARDGRTAPSLRIPRRTSHVGKCVSKKIRFPSWDVGVAAAVRVCRNAGPLVIRYCSACDGWHLIPARKAGL